MRRSLTNIALLASVATLLWNGPAWAYLDPGTGSMMLQLLLGGIAGAMVAGKLYWHRFRGFLTSRFSGKPRDGAGAEHAKTSLRPDGPTE
jgi:hypothetical protein